jgi:two-component system, cell cycle sensor histidine kinase and response regulator CckA
MGAIEDWRARTRGGFGGMTMNRKTSTDSARLRRQAEERLKVKQRKSGVGGGRLAAEDTQRLVHELQVHQIELEMQNEELQHVRAELEAGLGRYSDLYDFASAGYFSLDRDGMIRQVNLTGARLLGVERSRLVGGRFGRFVTNECHAPFIAFLEKAFNGLTKGVCELALRRDVDESIHVLITAAASEDGQECRIAAVDITERKRAEEALRESEKRYRHLFEAAKEGILILDADTAKVIDVNPFLTRLLGYSHTDLVGKSLWDFRSLKDLVGSTQAFAEMTAGEYVRREGLPLETTDGRRIDVEFVSNAYRVERTKVIQCNIRDVTERKRAERARENLEEQLRVSQKMEAIGSLAGGIAHDFNNLLSVILGYVGVELESLREGDPLRDDLLEVRKAGERGAALTSQLLAFSRKQVMQPVPLDLNHVAAGIEKMLRRIIGEDIELVQSLAPDLGLTLADPAQIDQVIMNLVINAREAMPDGGRLTIETANVHLDDDDAARLGGMKSGPHILLSVTDTGCGMDVQTRARLFEPFFTTKAMGKGTGLGLSTVYGIVKQSGGDIQVRSAPGQGSTFMIYLPRELLGVERAPSVPPPATRTGGTETIIVVEDEDAVRILAKRILRAAGYTVLAAASGGEALVACESHKGDIHLVLTDVVMPLMGGQALVQRLAKVRPKIKILYMSGYTNDAIVHHGVLDPGTHFIGKPFSAAKLTTKVREVLDSGGNETSAEPPTNVAARDHGQKMMS